MRTFIGLIKRACNLYNSIEIVGYILPSIIIYLMLFLPSVSASQNKVNLGLVEQLNNNYGDLHSIKVLKGEDFPYGEKGVDYAFCAAGKGMTVFEIYNDSNNQDGGSLRVSLMAFFPVKGSVDIAIKPDESMAHSKTFYAYLAAETKGIYIINITDPQIPQYITGCDTPGSASAVAMSGDYAFIADGDKGLQIINMFDKNNPVIAGSCDTLGSASGIAVSGEYAFIADGNSGLQVIDIFNKTNPVIIGSCDTPGSALDIAVSGDYAFMADANSGLQIIDVSDKTNPVITGSYDTPGSARDIAVSGDYAFVSDGYKGLQIIDISDKSHPFKAGSCDTQDYAKGIAISGDYAFIFSNTGLQVIDIYDKSDSMIIGSCETQSYISGVTISGDYAFATDVVNGLKIIDISDKQHLLIAGSCDTPFNASGVTVSGGYAFVADGDGGLQVIDISDKSHPVITGSCDTPDYAKGVAVSGEYAFMADGNSGLQIIDVSDKSHPVIAGNCDTPGYAYGVAISGDYAFMADANSDLQVIDISDKLHPVIAGSCETPDCAHGVAISGDYAFVADRYSGLQIINITDKTHPVKAGSCDTPGYASGVTISGDYAFIADGNLQIVDISDKIHPLIIGICDIPFALAQEVALSEDYVFVADDNNGLLQFKINYEPSPKANLILLNGGGINHQIDQYWNLSQRISNGVFNAFINNGYEVYDIYYMASVPQDIDNDGVPDQMTLDGLNEKTELESVIRKLPDGHLSNAGPLYLILIGHGADDQFQVSMDRENILSAQDLKTMLYNFLNDEYPDTHLIPPRPIVIILESAASGSFIDDLSGLSDLYEYPDLDLTVITSTGHGASYIKPRYDNGNPLPVSFTSIFISEMEDYRFEDHQTSLKEAFIRARDKLYFTYGNPFLDQAPQMYALGDPISFLLEDPNSPVDLNSPLKKLMITNGARVSLVPVAIYPDGTRIELDPSRLILLSSKPQVLDPANPDHIQISNGRIILTPEKGGIINFKNGITSLIAYHDPNSYYPCPANLLTAHLGLEVLIPGNPAAGGDKAIIVTGYRSQQDTPDSLWNSTNIIGNHAYESLRKRGYSRDDIIYLNPYYMQDVDRNSEYDDIDRIPSKENMDWAFGEIVETGTERLLIFLVDHGNKETFILNPKESLSAEYLGKSIASVIPNLSDRNRGHIQGPISLIIDACYSGSFISPLGGYIQENNGDPNQLIIITSGSAEQKVRFSAEGMISFSYPFFDELLLSNSIYNAFTYAKNHIPPSGQTPQISDQYLAQKMDQSLIYYLDEVRPLIEEREFYRDRGRLGIYAQVFSLSGIERVCALITSSAQGLSVALGEPLMDEPVIILEPQGPNPYGGTYFIEIDDPYPDAYNYQLILSVKDKKGMVATERTNLNNQERNNTGAIILVSDLGSVDIALKSVIDDQSHRVYSILREKNLRNSDIYYVKRRDCQYPDGIDDVPASFDIQDIQTWPLEMGYQIFLIYLIGDSQGGNFKLNNENLFYPQQILEDISLAQGCRLLLFCEFPDPQDFLDNLFLYNDSNDWTGIASPSIDPHRPLFSNYFFSRLYSFDSIGDAFIRAYKAFMPSQIPSQYIYPKDYSWNLDTIRKRLAYSLGDPALMGADPSLIRLTEVLEDDDIITLILTVNEFADIDTNTPSAELQTTSGEIFTIPMYQIDSIDIYKWEGTLSKDHAYSRAIFRVQQVQDANSPGIIDWREYFFTNSPEGSPIDPNCMDHFEPDNTPEEAKSIWDQSIINLRYQQQHTFHNPNDIDWVWFYALKDETYGIYAEHPDKIYCVQISLFNQNNLNLPLSSNPWYFSWRCPEEGYYYLKAEPASTGVHSFSYNLWIEDETGGVTTEFGDIYGRVLNEKSEGINGLLIHIGSPIGGFNLTRKTGSIYDINNSALDPTKTEGWFFFDNITTHRSYEITVTTENDLDNILANPFNVYLSPNEVVRIPDIIIEWEDNHLYYDLSPGVYKIVYKHWENLLNGYYPPDQDRDSDGFTNEEEFLNSTHPDNLTLKYSLYQGLNLFPFYSSNQYSASTFFDNMLEECLSIWGYDKQAQRWNYWGSLDEGNINFPLENGRGYIIYKDTAEVIYRDIYSTPGLVLAPGINILPVTSFFDPNYTSHQFIKDKKAVEEGDISITRCNSNEDGSRSKGGWETSYMFFGRPAGKDFEIRPDKAYIVYYQQDE